MKVSQVNIAVLIFIMSYLTASGMSNDSIQDATHDLKEVVVTAENYINKNGYEILLLSDKERNFGTNALDAISSMNRFVTSLNENKLLSWDRSEVFILINGVPSTATDLRSFKGKDIKNVEYYKVAPPQYMSLANGPVINVILKKHHDRLYSGYINTLNAVTTGYGTNQVDLSYTDSLNQVKIGYFVDYRNVSRISTKSDYDYGNFGNTSYDDNEKYSGALHQIQGSYQYFRTNHLFNAKLSLSLEPCNEISSGKITSLYDGSLQTNTNNSFLKTNNRAASLNLYYNYILKNNSVFAINVVNTLGKSHSESEIESPIYGTVNSLTKSNSYSFVANAFFASRALGGNYSVGSRYEYKQLNQDYTGGHTKPFSHNEFLNAGISWYKNGMTLAPVVALSIQSQFDGFSKSFSALPYFRLYADWWGKNKLQGLSVQLTLWSRKKTPSLSLLTDSYTYKDYHYIAKGNPDLKNFWDNTANISIVYFAPGRRDKIIFRALTNYTPKAIGSTLECNDGEAILRPVNLRRSFNTSFDLNGSWYPFSWLEISPYLEYYIFNYEASTPVKTTYFRYGGSVAVSFGNFEASLHANSPTKDFDGDLITRGSMQCAAVLQYKVRNWSFGAKYNFHGYDRTYAEIENFKLNEYSDWKPMHYLVRLSVTYSFSIGRSRNHGQKILNESSDDSGLNKYNTSVRH